MRLVFMGTPDFARACLETLHTEGFDIVGVYTKIDTPKNRGMKLLPSPVKRSEEHTSELQSPDNISYAVFCLKKKT